MAYAIREYVERYHSERPDQGLDHEIIAPPSQDTFSALQ